jgi:phosphoribosylaminoimidazolecarboxamide formyltransferase/IMP cyclohydrolase
VELRYGINPHQAGWTEPVASGEWPVTILNGAPSYINLLDALSARQLVVEAATALGGPVATSFKHVSPAGCAVDGDIDDVMGATWGVDRPALSPVARAYVRARDCDPKSSFGDFVAVSEPVDLSLAAVLGSVVSDGVIAPGFEPGVAALPARKKSGTYLVLEADATVVPPRHEIREHFGVRLIQDTDEQPITRYRQTVFGWRPQPDRSTPPHWSTGSPKAAPVRQDIQACSWSKPSAYCAQEIADPIRE